MSSDSAYGGRGPLILGVIWTEFLLTTILIALRAYVRKKNPRQTIWPLFWATSSWLFGVGTQVFITVSVAKGIGNHVDVLEQCGTFTEATLWVWVGQCFALISIGLGKIAAVSFILTIQGKTYPATRRLLIALAAVNFLIDFVVMIMTWFQCTPAAALWDTSIKKFNCDNVQRSMTISYVCGSINAFTDVFLALYPIGLLWRLQLKRRIKIGLGSLMSLGVFAGVCAAVKTSELPHMAITKDRSYDISQLVIWACTEQWVVLIVTSIPPLWTLVRAFFEGSSFQRLGNRKAVCPTRRPGEKFQGKGKATASTKAYAVNTETDSFHDSGDRRTSLPGDGILMTHNISVQQDEPDAEHLQQRLERFYVSGRPSVVEIPPNAS